MSADDYKYAADELTEELSEDDLDLLENLASEAIKRGDEVEYQRLDKLMAKYDSWQYMRLGLKEKQDKRPPNGLF